jgi:hypothetical protein
MSGGSGDNSIEIGLDILNTIRDEVTKQILAQLGHVQSGTSDADKVEVWQHVGFVSRPAKPEAGKQAAQAVSVRMGNHDATIAERDQRGIELAGAMEHGETCIYAPGEDGKAQGRILLKRNGNVAIITTQGNTPSGTSITVQVNTDGQIHMTSPLGGISITSDKITILSSTGAGAEFSSSGITLIGTGVNVNGGSVVLGAGAATGVCTQTSLIWTLLSALLSAIVSDLPVKTASPAALTAFTSALTAPSSFSMSVKAAG